jgi:hypothetical protein
MLHLELLFILSANVPLAYVFSEFRLSSGALLAHQIVDAGGVGVFRRYHRG